MEADKEVVKQVTERSLILLNMYSSSPHKTAKRLILVHARFNRQAFKSTNENTIVGPNVVSVDTVWLTSNPKTRYSCDPFAYSTSDLKGPLSMIHVLRLLPLIV